MKGKSNLLSEDSLLNYDSISWNQSGTLQVREDETDTFLTRPQAANSRRRFRV